MFVVFLITIINLIASKRIKSRFLIYILVIIGAFMIVIIFKNIIVSLIEATAQTKKSGLENVRIRAMGFYLTKMFPNGLSYIFGNGVASGKSEFASRMFMYSTKYGYYLADIGIIGNYVNYGAFFVLGIILMLWKIFKTKIEHSFNHLKYFFLVVLLTLPTGGGFSGSELIVVVCLSLYMLDVSSFFNKKQEEKSKTITYPAGNDIDTAKDVNNI